MAAQDKSDGGFGQPAANAESITPSDSTDLEAITRGIYVGGAGNIAVVMLGGGSVTFVGVLAGTILPIRVTRVKDTNTTATSLIGLY